MAERYCLNLIVCFFLLHGLVKGFEVEWHDGNKDHQLFTQEPACVSILATNLETYHGKLLYLLNRLSMGSFYTPLADIGTSKLRFRSGEEFLKLRHNHLFSYALASSSCLISIIETFSEDEVLDLIDMVNDFRADRKSLLLKVPTFNENMFKNITINYDVTIEHRDEGNININT